ncbi:hypothetical protein [Palaeococcus ferrophilus]|uniref:hypothetical protein n=1 Tax=Palaeococcus ferrophilus TaxID=83868 RepID=UPI00064E902C|nr:hypothetical protein [Palaeococcus ferrophilus]
MLSYSELFLIASIYIYALEKSNPPLKVPTDESFVSSYVGYVAGYVNETVPLHVYLLNTNNANFNGTVGVRNLPPCLESEGVSVGRYPPNGFVMSIALRLKEPGRCVMDKAYLEVRRGESLKKAPLGRVEFDVMEPSGEQTLGVPTYVEASRGSTPSMPRLVYTLSNPFDERVEIVNVTFDVPGLGVEGFDPRDVHPGGEANLTVRLTNTGELNDLYVIRPLIVYKVNGKTYSMPAQPYYYITLPDGKG